MKYSKAVKQALAYMVWYDTFKEGRVIVKQDDPGTRMYFVISGEVDLKRTDFMESGKTLHSSITFFLKVTNKICLTTSIYMMTILMTLII
jgi:hypothetical protein